MDVVEKLMANIKVNAAGCFEWQGKRLRSGYGVCCKRINGKQESLAHRVSYLTFNGPIEAGGVVCHRCDNPCCVNPHHLFTGTHADNVRDCIAKGRNIRGEKQHFAKMDDAIVSEIRRSYRPGDNLTAIGRKYGVTFGAVKYAITGDTWKHLGDGPVSTVRPRKIQPEQYDEVRRLVSEIGCTATSRKFGVSHSVVSRIVHQTPRKPRRKAIA